MNMGAQQAETQPYDGIDEGGGQDWTGPFEHGGEAATWDEEQSAPSGWGVRLFGTALLLLALGWVGAFGWSLYRARPEPTLDAVLGWIGQASAPLVLLALLWLAFGRSRRRETERFTRAVAAMRRESEALDGVLATVAGRIEDNHVRLTGETAKLMSLGDEASDRLGRVTHYLAKEGAVLDERASALENAASAARVDIGVLLHDLPRAEEQARLVAEAMKEAGLTAHGQAVSLEGQLSALSARGRDADEVVGGAAQRLAAHLARIESSSAAAADRMGQAAQGMNEAIDGTMARAAEAIDATRSGLAAQGATLLAMVDQSRTALELAGDETGRSLAARLEAIGASIASLAGQIEAQDSAARALAERLGGDLADLDSKFATLGANGSNNADSLAGSISAVRASVKDLYVELDEGHERASYLIDRAQDMAEAIAGVTGQLSGPLSSTLAEVERQAGQTRAAADSIAPTVEAIGATSEQAAVRMAEAEVSAARQRESIDALFERLTSGLAAAEGQIRALETATRSADGAAAKLASGTGPELIEALVRVREAANQAAERAREAIAAVIPESSAALGDAAGAALVQAIAGPVSEHLQALNSVSEGAVEAARKASERLTRQLVTIGASAAAIEARIEEAEADRQTKDSDGLSRTLTLLIESLNSTAIDVTKILSNDVTDSAWAAYLKGDRGVFTRRAVRLLDSTEAREIVAHYDAEPEFRAQVNRYVHDFEAMLRRVLADRDGSPLAVTLLSSDMGKLYVALAQAIERLR